MHKLRIFSLLLTGGIITFGTVLLSPQELSSTQPSAQAAVAQRPAPTASYTRKSIQGWQVLVSAELGKQHPTEAAQVEKHLSLKLAELRQLLPTQALKQLKDVKIWLEWQDPANPGGVYHPSADWLREHGFNPDMAGGIELGNARNFLAWSQNHDQPLMVLHEFAHAYHHQILGYDRQDIQQAYTQAKAAGNYRHVTRHVGPPGPAYAMTNAQEYFAESSEAFFGSNDFYPYVRSELKSVDPHMYKLLFKLWKIPQAHS